MTFQTSPYMPWTFPDEAIQMNKLGVHSMRPTYVKPFEGNVGSLTSWYDDARKEALERVQNTQRAKQGMEGHLNTTARSQRYERPASRSAVPNGVFPGMEYVTSAGLRGGVITSKEGREWLATRLQQRREEYAAISSGNFSRGPPKAIPVSPYTDVDSLFQQIFAAFGSGSFTSSISTLLTQLLQGIIKIGSTIQPSQLGNYARAVQKLAETIRGYRGGEPGLAYDRPNIEDQLMGEEARPAIYNPAEERLRLVESMQTTLKLIDGVIREIARTINEPQSAREQVMSTLSQRLLGEQIAAFRPGFASEEAQTAVAEVPGVEMGVPSGSTLIGTTFNEAERQRREEEAARAEQEMDFEAGPPGGAEAPPVMNSLFPGNQGQGKKRRGRPRKYKY